MLIPKLLTTESNDLITGIFKCLCNDDAEATASWLWHWDL
jgi:hypothetical protein